MARFVPLAAILVMVGLTVGGSAADDGYLGVQVQADADGKGILVIQPLEDAPAAKAGVKANDLILKADGKEVKEVQPFILLIRAIKPRTPIELLILRDGKEIKVRVTVGKRP